MKGFPIGLTEYLRDETEKKKENKRRNQLILTLTDKGKNDKSNVVNYENYNLSETAKSPI